MIQDTNKKVNTTAYDYDGVASIGVFEKGGIIITGRPRKDNEEILAQVGEATIYNYPSYDLTDSNRNRKIGRFKSRVIKEIGIKKFYEDTLEQIDIIQKENPNIEVVRIFQKMKYICFTYDGTIAPIAYKLQEEGNEVIFAQIYNNKNILTPEEVHEVEKPEKKKCRLEIYNGLLKNKVVAEDFIKEMKNITDHENWFVLCDSNLCFKFTEEAEKMGFTGILPTEEDRIFEVDRKKAKDFVIEHYSDIKVAEVHDFTAIEEGIQFLEETEDFWVLKSQGDSGDTVVPESEDVELNKEQLIDSLRKQQKEYEQNGFILEKKIMNPIELTPEIIFFDGEPVCVSLDIENKPMGAGNEGTQTGCSQNLIVKLDFDSPLAKIAFPEIVYEIAKERKGIFVWDASILIDPKDGEMYFGEFCSNRFGWDSFPTETAMNDDYLISSFFLDIMHGKNPLKVKYGAGVRVLNIDSGCKILEEGLVSWSPEATRYIYPYEIKLKKDEESDEIKFESTSSSWDLALIAGVSDDLDEAITKCYNNVKLFAFDAKYTRPEFDFRSTEYPTAIMNRLNYAEDNHLL